MGDFKSDVTHWYVADGQPLFANMQCQEAQAGLPILFAPRVWLTTNFQKLPMRILRGNCFGEVDQPASRVWEKQIKAVKAVAKHVPGAFRLDIYPGDEDVIFSEFTFTPFACRFSLKPHVSDGLMHAMDQGEIDARSATPEYVARTILDKSWMYVGLNGLGNGTFLGPKPSFLHPSPVDLVEAVMKRRDKLKVKAGNDCRC